MSDYYQDATSQILQLLRDTFQGTFKEYFDGVPNEDLPEGAFPCVIVHKIDGTVEFGPTGQDIVRSRINIHFLLNQADDVNASADQDVTLKKLRYLIEGRDKTTGQYLPGTALYALRTQITLNGVTLEQDTDIQYDVTFRPNLPSISEATLLVMTEERVSVPVRN